MELESWFEEFWATYPKDLSQNKKGVKGLAKRAVEKLKPDEKLQDEIMVKLRELMRHYRKEKQLSGKTDRWPFASTWINQCYWTMFDDIESTVDLVDRSNKNKCKCGGPVEWGGNGGMCWDCHDKISKDVRERKEMLYRQLCENGKGKKPGQTKEEWLAGFKGANKITVL